MSLFYGSGEMWCITNFQGHGSLVIHTNSREAENKMQGWRQGRQRKGRAVVQCQQMHMGVVRPGRTIPLSWAF